jgi:hypothetical protein
MACSLLAEAQLPKVFWLWSVWEAVQRMNLTPIETPTSEVTAKGDPIKVLTTAHALFYGVKPDLHIIFPFRAVGSDHRPSDGGRGKRMEFESKAFTGIALGRSDNANGIMFWNPALSIFCILAGERVIAGAFPDIAYDGGIYVKRSSTPIPKTPMPNPSLLELKYLPKLAKHQTATP